MGERTVVFEQAKCEVRAKDAGNAMVGCMLYQDNRMVPGVEEVYLGLKALDGRIFITSHARDLFGPDIDVTDKIIPTVLALLKKYIAETEVALRHGEENRKRKTENAMRCVTTLSDATLKPS